MWSFFGTNVESGGIRCQGKPAQGHDLGSGAGEAHHFLAFSRSLLSESANPLSSWLGAPVFGGALQPFISHRRRRAGGIKVEFAVDAMISQQKWRRVS